MRVVDVVFIIGWAAFWIYWLVIAFTMKTGQHRLVAGVPDPVLLAVVVILLLRAGAFRHHGVNTDPWRAGVGLVLFVLGLGFAVWARVHIGRNWGTPMSRKDEPSW